MQRIVVVVLCLVLCSSCWVIGVGVGHSMDKQDPPHSHSVRNKLIYGSIGLAIDMLVLISFFKSMLDHPDGNKD